MFSIKFVSVMKNFGKKWAKIGGKCEESGKKYKEVGEKCEEVEEKM